MQTFLLFHCTIHLQDTFLQADELPLAECADLEVSLLEEYFRVPDRSGPLVDCRLRVIPRRRTRQKVRRAPDSWTAYRMLKTLRVMGFAMLSSEGSLSCTRYLMSTCTVEAMLTDTFAIMMGQRCHMAPSIAMKNGE
jgi:hypothetical protein